MADVGQLQIWLKLQLVGVFHIDFLDYFRNSIYNHQILFMSSITGARYQHTCIIIQVFSNGSGRTLTCQLHKKCDFLCTEYLDKRGTPALSSFWNIYIFFLYIYIWCTSIATFSHDDSDCVRAVGNPPSHLFHVFSSIHKQRWHHQKLSSKITLCFVPTAQISPPFFEKKKKTGCFQAPLVRHSFHYTVFDCASADRVPCGPR